jgi:S1-C subfamily serine protease
MIRKILERTKSATYAILVPSPQPERRGMPVASGTGFMIDGTGFFLTAHHVVNDADVPAIWLQQSHEPGGAPKTPAVEKLSSFGPTMTSRS